MSKVFLSRQTKLPFKQEDYDSYTKAWKDEFDSKFKELHDNLGSNKDINLAKASKDKRLKKKADKIVKKSYSDFNATMEAFRADLEKEYTNKIEIEVEYKDFDLARVLKDFPGQHMVGAEKDTDNILVVVNG